MSRKRLESFRRDLFHLAAALSLIRVTHLPPAPHTFTAGSDLNALSNVHFRCKAVLENLYTIGSFRHDFPLPNPVEISAYVLDAPSNGVSTPSRSSRPTEDDSGISDVESGGGRSPLLDIDGFSAYEEPPLFIDTPFLTDLEPSTGNLDSYERSVDPVNPVAFSSSESFRHEAVIDGLHPSHSQVDDSTGLSLNPDRRLRSASDDSTETSFSPDEEDVENQLMHIDDQLIRLDDSIENINDLNEAILFRNVAGDDDEETEADYALQNNATVAGDLYQPFDAWQMDSVRDLEDFARICNSSSGFQEGAMATEVSTLASTVNREAAETNAEVLSPGIVSFGREDDDVKVNESEFPDAQSIDPVTSSLYDHDPEVFSIPSEELDPAARVSSEHSYSIHPCDEPGVEISDKDGSRLTSISDSQSLSPSFYPVGGTNYKTRESRDKRKARQMCLPISVLDIIETPMEEFTELLDSHDMTEDQISLCRDIRRRGKNKVAAQNCRRRKLDLIRNLQEQVSRVRHHKRKLLMERQQLYRLRDEWTNKLVVLEDKVLRGLNKSSEEFALQLSPDSRQIHVTPRA